MSATILKFSGNPMRPRPAPTPVFARDWVERHLPLIDASLVLLEADDVEFERRCRLMADEDGRAMLDALCGQIDRLGRRPGRRRQRARHDGSENKDHSFASSTAPMKPCASACSLANLQTVERAA